MPLRRLSRPRQAGAPAHERRVPHLPSAIVGNGELLATLSARGEIERLFWPHVDWGQHLGELRIGLALDGGKTQWLDEQPFEHEQRYHDDANVLETTAEAPGVRATITDFAAPDESVLFRRVAVDGRQGRLVVYVRPEMEESRRYGGAYVDGETGALVFYRRGTALAVGTTPRPRARTGRSHADSASPVFEDARDAELGRGPVEYGSVDGALTADFDRTACCAVAFGASPDAALAALTRALQAPRQPLDARRAHDGAALAGAHEPALARPGLRRLYRRSLLVFDLLTDRRTGGVIAAPEMDGDFRRSGGYGFVWGRDMAFSVLGFLAAGRDDLARSALRWLLRTQAPEGLWLHRHWTDGSLAPSWGLHQIDETGSSLFAFEAAWRELGDRSLDEELWPAARRAADFLVEFRDPQTGLTRPSVDLWEERYAEHAYSAAAVQAGLRAAAAMAERHEPGRAATYGAAASELAAAVERELWDEELRRFRRGLWATDHGQSRLRYPAEMADSVSANGAGAGADVTVDASLLGLAWPYCTVAPGGARMRATVEALRERLLLPDGGARRYDGDAYAGGNAWILTTLWLGLWCRQTGDEDGYLRAVDYVLARQTAVGLLPEQTGPDGTPSWVVPLTWSHAMLVLASRPELAIVAELGRAGRESVPA